MNIVCVHGSGACRESWHYQLTAFENVTAVDLPGHPVGELLPTIPQMVTWLHDYISDAGLSSELVLFGHSLGGGVILQYALDYPGAVKGLVLVGTGARLRVNPQTLEALARDVEADAPWDPLAGYEQIDPDVAQVLANRRVENGLRARLNDLKACDEFDIMPRLAELSMPALAICGTKDVMTPPKYTEFLAERLPNAKGVVVAGGTHQVHLEKPDEVNREIKAFLASI